MKLNQLRKDKDGKLEPRPRFKTTKHKGRCKGAFGGGKSIKEMVSHIK